ncbi:MAG TPA: TlpA disulfide reductase family protein [Saprospiraceae bacterium]|nr:TlpA disulfide reductase family protein [Saprospiraceae bacterium]
MKLLTTLCAVFLIQTLTCGNPMVLSVQLDGYKPLEHNNFAYIIIPDVNFPYKEQFKISDEGLIQSSVLINHTRELIFSYNEREISIIVSPGDQAALHLSIETFQSLNGPITGEYKGIQQQAVTLMLNYLPTLTTWIDASSNAFNTDKSIPLPNYRAIRLQEMAIQLAAFDRLVTENYIDNPEFIHWAKAKIRYAAATDLCMFPFMSRVNKDIHEADPYFDFIDSFTPENDFVAALQSYIVYAKAIISDLQLIGNIAEVHRVRRDSLAKSGSVFPLKFDIIRNTLHGKELEVGLANLYLNAKKIPPAYLDSLNRYLSVEDIQKVETNDVDRNTPLITLLKKFPLREEEKKPLLDLYQDAEGKIVYHDFWFTKCGPCMRELPHYNKLMELAGSDVVFIFYGVYMQEQEWIEAVAKYELKGKHYLLSKNQVAFYEKYFALNGFPHHQIIDSGGIIVKSHLPSVNPENFETILRSLNNLRQ